LIKDLISLGELQMAQGRGRRAQWKHKYDVLKDYITANPEIHIDASEVSIPGHLRNEFYKHFDDIRNSFIESSYASLPFEMDALCRNYIQSEKELTELLSLDRIELPVDLWTFLHNPKDGLVRWLYNRLFEMVQGKITVDDFEQMGHQDLTATAAELFRLGYEAWAAITLILSLEPDGAFGVGLDEDYEPLVAELKEIAFGRQFHNPAKRLPEFILHSKKLNRHIAIKMPLAREVDSYYIPYEIPKRMLRHHTGDTSHVLGSRIMFLSILQDPKEIPVFIDMYTRQIKSPDLTVEFLMEQNLANPDEIGQVKRRVEIMRPRLGCGIVVMNPEPAPDMVKPAENMDIFSVGLDPLKLQPIVDKLA
jgi:hypothetical protein